MKHTYTSVFSHLRIATAVTLTSAAAALAFVAVNPSGPLLARKSTVDEDAFSRFSKFRQDRDQLLSSKLALPGVERDGVPRLAAEEDYANRAYPATDIPFSATLNAQKAFKNVQTRSNSNPNSNIGIWNLIGPSTGNVPDILTFSGAPTTYSGRITALAIDPSCNNTTCRLWVAAAGGGVWRTDNAFGR